MIHTLTGVVRLFPLYLEMKAPNSLEQYELRYCSAANNGVYVKWRFYPAGNFAGLL